MVGTSNGMEDTKLVKKNTVWNPIGVRTKGQEVINDLKKLKLRNWSQIVKDRKAWNDLVQKAKTQVALY